MRYENKLNIDGARVLWNSYEITVEEVPVKGAHKLRLRRTVINTAYAVHTMHRDDYIIDNLLLASPLDAAQGYDDTVAKLKNEIAIAHFKPANKQVEAIHAVSIHEDTRHYLEVVPEGVEGRTVECKDFVLSVEWTKFSAYSPDSDFQQSDPHYTQIAAKSPAAGRKLYKLVQQLEAKKYDFKALAWSDLSAFLQEHKVAYDYHFSQWS